MICEALWITDQICDLGDNARFSNQAVIQLHTKQSEESVKLENLLSVCIKA